MLSRNKTILSRVNPLRGSLPGMAGLIARLNSLFAPDRGPRYLPATSSSKDEAELLEALTAPLLKSFLSNISENSVGSSGQGSNSANRAFGLSRGQALGQIANAINRAGRYL